MNNLITPSISHWIGAPSFANALTEELPSYHEEAEKPPMRWYPRLDLYKASNVSFDPKTRQAYSYSWWRFVDVIGGRVIFNSYRYSVTTAKHQRQVKRLLRYLNIKIDFEFEAPDGLQRDLASAVAHYRQKIDRLEKKVAARGSRKSKNTERLTEIALYRKIAKQIGKLMLERAK